MDGVLVDTYEAWFPLVNEAARAWGLPPVSRERFETTWGQSMQADVETFLAGRSLADVEAYYVANFRRHAERMTVNPDSRPVLAALRQAGVPTAVITNSPSALAREILGAAEVEADLLVGGSDVARPKPAPDMVLRACELLGVAPARSLFVGDSRFDRDAARAAGARFAGYGGKVDGGDAGPLAGLADVLRWIATDTE